MVYALDINPTTFAAARFGDFASIINILIPLLTTFGAIVFLGMIIFAAFTYMTAADNPESLVKAQKIFFSAIIGLLIVVGGFLIVKLIGFILNIGSQIPL